MEYCRHCQFCETSLCPLSPKYRTSNGKLRDYPLYYCYFRFPLFYFTIYWVFGKMLVSFLLGKFFCPVFIIVLLLFILLIPLSESNQTDRQSPTPPYEMYKFNVGICVCKNNHPFSPGYSVMIGPQQQSNRKLVIRSCMCIELICAHFHTT